MTAIKHLAYLKLLSEYCNQKSPAQFKALVNSSSPRELKAVCEIILNVLQGKLPAPVAKLKKYRNTIRTLADTKLGAKPRKRHLKRSGRGFLGLIFAE